MDSMSDPCSFAETPLAQLRKLRDQMAGDSDIDDGYINTLSTLLTDLEAVPPQPTRGDVAEQLISRCTSFLGNGGFFNPEMMEQRKATQLILDCRDFLIGEAAASRPADRHEAIELIARIFTGEGAQLENLDLSDDEWRALCVDHGNDPEHFEIALHLDDWLALGRIARQFLQRPAVSPAVEGGQEESAERTVASIAAMLGWGNVPPRETLERDIAALKSRAVKGGREDEPTREYTIRICDDCYALKGEMCHEPECVFCRRTMAEVGEMLDALLIRPLVDGERLDLHPAALHGRADRDGDR